MGWILDEAKRHLDRREVRYDDSGDMPWAKAQFAPAWGKWVLFVQEVDDEWLAFFAYCPVNVPVHRRAAVAELLHRINWTLLGGGFDIDVRDGEVRFRASARVSPEALDPVVFDDHLDLVLGAVERYIPAVLQLAFSYDDPIEALASVDPEAAAEEVEDEDEDPPLQ